MSSSLLSSVEAHPLAISETGPIEPGWATSALSGFRALGFTGLGVYGFEGIRVGFRGICQR